jgi:hypothetical protein
MDQCVYRQGPHALLPQHSEEECASPSERDSKDISEGLLSPGYKDTLRLALNAPRRIHERDPYTAQGPSSGP